MTIDEREVLRLFDAFWYSYPRPLTQIEATWLFLEFNDDLGITQSDLEDLLEYL